MKKTLQHSLLPARLNGSILRGRFIIALWLICLTGCQSFCAPCSFYLPSLPTIPRLGIFRKPLPPPFLEVQKYSLFTSPRLQEMPPRRVVLVPTGFQSGDYQAPNQFADALAAAMRGAGVSEVVFPPQIKCSTTVDGILNGQFDEREIAQLARTWSCDAVMFVRVNQFQGHPPLKASVTAALVDARESVVLFAVDGIWDTADPEIKQGFEHFVIDRTVGVHDSAREIYFQSPQQLFAYAAYQMTAALKGASGL